MSHTPFAICPWLGSDEDRKVRFREPLEAHRCYAQARPAAIDADRQAQVCLGGEYTACPFYVQAPPPEAPRPLSAAADEVGPPPQRPASLLRTALWVLVALAALAVAVVYGRQLLRAPLPPAPTPSPPPTATLTLTPAASQAALATATRAIALPTSTPTPFPGGSIQVLDPAAGAAGWVAGDEARGNHLGDSYLYTGVFGGVIYHGIFQLDLSPLPRGATIHSAVLELTGLSAQRLAQGGIWQVRALAREEDAGWSRKTFQEIHNAEVLWTLLPALAAADLGEGSTNRFALSQPEIAELEQRLVDEHYTLSIRIDGPLAGADDVYAWDSGYAAATQGRGPRLIVSVGPAPQTPLPSGSPPPTESPTPTQTPEWVVVTSTPTPANILTAAAEAARETAWATTTGTATATPWFLATATPPYIVITRTPTPENQATALYWRALATAYAVLTGTPTPAPPNLATTTFTPRPTQTEVFVWLDTMTGTPTPTNTPTPPPMPSVLRGKILFLSDRGSAGAAYMLDPASGRVAVLTARWPYDQALQRENVAPDGQAWAYVQEDAANVPQIYVYYRQFAGSRQVTFNSGLNYDPVWSPTGDLLAFVSDCEGNDEIYTVGPGGQNQQRLTFNQWEWDKHPSWSPDGTQIVFWSNQTTGRSQLWIMNADGKGRRILLNSLFNDWDPVWVK